MGFASVISQALYLVLVQKSSQSLSAKDTLYLNSYNTFPLLLTASLLFGEFSDGFMAFQYTDIAFVFVFTLVIVMGMVLNYLLFLCTVYNSALTTSITGTLKGVVQAVIGLFAFGGMSMNIFSMTGLFINISGGVLYSYAKFKDNQARQMAKSKSMAVLDRMERGGSGVGEGVDEKALLYNSAASLGVNGVLRVHKDATAQA